MIALPPVPPVKGWHHSTRLPRDHYIRLDSNDYSVHRRRDRATDRGQCRPGPGRDFRGGRLIVDEGRIWAKHQTISDPQHVTAARMLRRERLEIVRPAAEPAVEQRCLRRTAPASSALPCATL